MAPLRLKIDMMAMLFDRFQVPAVHVATAPLLPAYAYNCSSGLVVDIGDSSAQIVPIMDGFIMDPYVKRVPHLGGARETSRIMTYLLDEAKGVNEDEISFEEYTVRLHAQAVKDRLAFCPPDHAAYKDASHMLTTVKGFMLKARDGIDTEEEFQKAMHEHSIGGASFRGRNLLPLQQALCNAGEVMFQPQEVLDDKDESIISIAEMIVDVVEKCGVDARRPLLSNVCLSGGVTCMRGFQERLEMELRVCAPWAARYLRVVGDKKRYAVWTGGSAIATLPGFIDQWNLAWDRK
jgi:actin